MGVSYQRDVHALSKATKNLKKGWSACTSLPNVIRFVRSVTVRVFDTGVLSIALFKATKGYEVHLYLKGSVWVFHISVISIMLFQATTRTSLSNVEVTVMKMYAVRVYWCHAKFQCPSWNIVRGITISIKLRAQNVNLETQLWSWLNIAVIKLSKDYIDLSSDFLHGEIWWALLAFVRHGKYTLLDEILGGNFSFSIPVWP